MNLFIVPSWYPSPSNPSYGIFIKEQIIMLAKQRPDWKIGVSTWGQGDVEKLIWVKDHIRNLRKFNKHSLDKAKVHKKTGYIEYYQPALSWTKRFRKGNLADVIRCNELNYQAFALEYGKPDVIMVQASYPGILIADYLAKKYEVPIYLHIRLGGFMYENMLKDLGSMKEELLKATSKVKLIAVTSSFHRLEIQPRFPNTHPIANPVDVNHFQLGKNFGEYALAIGRFEEEKGFDLLIEALTKVPDLNVRIVGSGSQKNELSKKILELGLDARIQLHEESNREEVKMHLQGCKFLILPSRYETFGNVLLEAMACGKPIVATKCGGPIEIVTDACGYLSEVNSDDLGDKIQQMTENYHLFKSNEIRKIVIDKYPAEHWASQLEELLKMTLSK